jgi:RNA polymerase sigma-70 factor (ECF subfamily)
MAPEPDSSVWAAAPSRLERVLLAQHARFLDFVARRIGSRAQAEEVLQSAYVRALESGVPEDADDGVMAWFYRVLRNALLDAARRQGASDRALAGYAAERPEAVDTELERTVCACLHDVLPALEPEYAGVVRAVDLERRPLADVAAAHSITVSNAAVRLHRARQSLKKPFLRTCRACAAHGCLDRRCRGHGTRPAAPGT